MNKTKGRLVLNRQEILQQIRATRIGYELQSLLGLALGYRYRFFLAALLQVVLTLLLIAVITALMGQLLPLPECFLNCRSQAGSQGDCCYFSLVLMLYWFLALAAILVLSFFGTRWVSDRRLLHSAFSSALLIVFAAAGLYWLGFSFVFVLIAAGLSFLVSFWGYRLAL